MAKKKVESWYWWIATDVSSIPLYFVKHYVFTSVYYLILLIMAFFGFDGMDEAGKNGKTTADGPIQVITFDLNFN